MKNNSLQLNPAQMLFHDACYSVRESYQVWGRGTGKSSYGIGITIRNIVHFLPRSKWLIVAESYKSMLENTLPSTVRALEGLGYYRNHHYFLGVRPPKDWPTSFEPPTKGFTNAITFFNGTMFQLVSQDSAATSARGLNTDGVIIDEALNLDKEHYDAEILPTIRANKMEFGSIPFHHGQFFFSSMPYGNNAEWLTNRIKYYEKDGRDNARMMNLLIDAQLAFLKETSISKKEGRWRDVVMIRRELKWYPKKVDGIPTFYMESNSFDNIRVLGYDYINNIFRSTVPLKFMTEIMNRRMNKIEGAFYGKFDRNTHTYKRFWSDPEKGVYDYDRLIDSVGQEFDYTKSSQLGCLQDKDCISLEPLYIGLDFGGNINSLVVGQHLPYANRFNFIKDFHVKSPDTIDELADDFCAYYKNHPTKFVNMYYDRFGNQNVGNSRLTYAQQFSMKLEEAGWTVVLHTQGNNPEHHLKYLLWARLLSDPSTPTIALNFYNCQDLIYSMEGTKIKDKDGLIKKDKSREGKNLETEEHEPHLSDAADYIIHPLFRDIITDQMDFMPTQAR